ncbi:ABC transporter ATP-binding protein, partial [Rhizobium ruizarguesonis]
PVEQADDLGLLDGLVREDGLTLLFITHDIALASGFVDRIAVFRNARLVEAGPVRSVLSAPKSDYTAALIASHRDLATPPLIEEVAS